VKPEVALEAARRLAARRRAAGDYAESPATSAAAPAGQGVTLDQLLEWASIEPDMQQLYSTRRLGAPVTRVKQMLARGLQQYLNQLVGQQSRFNLQLVVYVGELADRIERLEEEASLRRAPEQP